MQRTEVRSVPLFGPFPFLLEVQSRRRGRNEFFFNPQFGEKPSFRLVALPGRGKPPFDSLDRVAPRGVRLLQSLRAIRDSRALLHGGRRDRERCDKLLVGGQVAAAKWFRDAPKDKIRHRGI
jgi:hypothetical protein